MKTDMDYVGIVKLNSDEAKTHTVQEWEIILANHGLDPMTIVIVLSGCVKCHQGTSITAVQVVKALFSTGYDVRARTLFIESFTPGMRARLRGDLDTYWKYKLEEAQSLDCKPIKKSARRDIVEYMKDHREIHYPDETCGVSDTLLVTDADDDTYDLPSNLSRMTCSVDATSAMLEYGFRVLGLCDDADVIKDPLISK